MGNCRREDRSRGWADDVGVVGPLGDGVGAAVACAPSALESVDGAVSPG